MRVVYMGTPAFAVKPLEALISAGHSVVGVVCQPDRERDKKGNIIPPPVKVAAQAAKIPLFQFERIGSEGIEPLSALKPDIMVTAAYGQILTSEILQIAKHGVINLHASLLPKYRGSSPVQHAILNGEEETGITIMQTALGLDTGDIISVQKMPLASSTTAGEALEELSEIGANLLINTLKDIESGRARWLPQQAELATKCPLIKKSDGLIDWEGEAKSIVNKVHAFNPWPLAHTFLEGKRLNIFKAERYEGIIPRKLFLAGEISTVGGNFIVATKAGDFVRLLEVQLEGKKRMSGSDFVKGLRSFFLDSNK